MIDWLIKTYLLFSLCPSPFRPHIFPIAPSGRADKIWIVGWFYLGRLRLANDRRRSRNRCRMQRDSLLRCLRSTRWIQAACVYWLRLSYLLIWNSVMMTIMMPMLGCFLIVPWHRYEITNYTDRNVVTISTYRKTETTIVALSINVAGDKRATCQHCFLTFIKCNGSVFLPEVDSTMFSHQFVNRQFTIT